MILAKSLRMLFSFCIVEFFSLFDLLLINNECKNVKNQQEILCIPESFFLKVLDNSSTILLCYIGYFFLNDE